MATPPNPNIETNDTTPEINPEHEKLIEVLKFVPKTVTVQMWGYGGDARMGRIDQKTWDFFRENRINVSDFAWDGSYGEDEVPDDLKPFSPGSWYDCDGLVGAYGVSSGTIEITDEDEEEVYRQDLDNVDDDGVMIEELEEAYIKSAVQSGPIFYGYSSEKGTFFEGEINLTAPFDPEKLKLLYSSVDGEYLFHGVEYDGEDIDNNGGNTNGKGSSFCFYNLVDGEVVSYETGYDVDENFDDGTPPSGPSPEDWEKSKKITEGNPTISGWYSCSFSHGSTWGSLYWNNEKNIWEDYYNGRITATYETVTYYQGYNWDTSDWANRPAEPVDAKCNNKKCDWVGKRDDMREDEENYSYHCPKCDSDNWEWIEYDPDTAKGRKNRKTYIKS
jgi:hypothetical protein